MEYPPGASQKSCAWHVRILERAVMETSSQPSDPAAGVRIGRVIDLFGGSLPFDQIAQIEKEECI